MTTKKAYFSNGIQDSLKDHVHHPNQFVFDSVVQTVLNTLPYYVLVVNQKHEILFANKAAEESKINLEDLIRGYYPMSVNCTNQMFEHCPLNEAVLTGRPVENEYFYQSLNKYIKTEIYPFQHCSFGEQTVYLHISQDVTHRIIADEQMRLDIMKLKNITHSFIDAITKTVENRDPYTASHQNRVSRLAVEIGRKMGIGEEEIKGIEIAALVHDIGKKGIPSDILSKPGPINVHEYNLIKVHSEMGYEILRGIEFPWPVAQIVLQHHERMDGSGYPNGLKGNEILIEARIISVADVVEAMCCPRSYRLSLSLQEALDNLNKGKNSAYDADVVEACIELFADGFRFD